MKALLLLDAQVNMFEGGVHAGGGSDALLRTLRSLLQAARAAGAPVIHVQHCGGPGEVDEPGKPGWHLHPELEPAPGEVVVQKHKPDAFHMTPLARKLEELGVTELVIAGMQTEMCIDATVRRAAGLGLRVTLVQDAHGTFDNATMQAADVIRSHNQALAGCAQLASAGDIGF